MTANLPVPKTAVPLGIADPVEKARAELKAALFAIEDKANVPKRVQAANERNLASARRTARTKPAQTAAVVVGVAVVVGAAVWGLVRLYTR